MMWSGATTRAQLQQSIHKLWRLSEVPQAPEENCLFNEQPSKYHLSVLREQEIASNLAFLSATTDEGLRVMAVCLEERPDGRGITIRIASNTGDLTALTSGIRRLADVLEQAARRENTRTQDQDTFFQQAVSLDTPRILSRLRSRHAKNSRKQVGKPAVIRQLDEVLGDESLIARPDLSQLSLSTIRGQAKSLEALFVQLEAIPDKSRDTAKLQQILQQIIREAHDIPASDLVIALRDYPGPTNLKTHLSNAIGKLGRYFSVSCELICAARDRAYGVFRNIHVEPYIIDVPPGIQDDSYKVHAEIQLLFFYETHPNLPRPRVICSSKSACYLCNLFFRLHSSFQVPRTHGRIYDKWTLPDWLDIPPERRSSLAAITGSLRSEIDGRFRAISKGKKRPYSHPNESILLPSAQYPSSSALSGGSPIIQSSRLTPDVLTAPDLASRTPHASTNIELVGLAASSGTRYAINGISQVGKGGDNLPYKHVVTAPSRSLFLRLNGLSLSVDFDIGVSGYLLISRAQDTTIESRDFPVVRVEDIPITRELQFDCRCGSNELDISFQNSSNGIIRVTFVWESVSTRIT